jgi:hypothetical protein
MFRELWCCLQDWRECGDLWGHLVAWWHVVSEREDVDAPIPYYVTPLGFAEVLYGGQDPDCQGGDRQGAGDGLA